MTDHRPHIVLPTDLNSDAYHALQLVLQLDSELRARLTLMHVVQSADFRNPKRDLSALEMLRASVHLHPAAARACPTIAKCVDRELDAFAHRLRRRVHPEWIGHLAIDTAIRYGDPASEIVRYSQEAHADMIVLNAKPRNGWWNWKSRISDQVLRNANCRVVLVHDPQPLAVTGLVRSFSVHNEPRPAMSPVREAHSLE
jgi:nucleotide-binding universal stress UspA family protein